MIIFILSDLFLPLPLGLPLASSKPLLRETDGLYSGSSGGVPLAGLASKPK